MLKVFICNNPGWGVPCEPRSIDAVLVSMLKHIMYVPFKFPIKDYALSQQTLVDYSQRMDDQFGLKQLGGAH